MGNPVTLGETLIVGETLVLGETTMLLGDDLLEWILLALGGALLVGNVLALLRPPRETKDGDLERAPVLRSVAYAAIGAVAAIWALASLLAG